MRDRGATHPQKGDDSRAQVGLAGTASPVRRGSRQGLPGSRKGKIGPFFNPEGGLRIQMESAGGCLPVRRSSERELPGDRAGIIGTFFNPEGGPRIQVGSAGDVSLFVAVQSGNCPAAGKTKLTPFFNALVPFPPAKLPSAKFPTILKRACPGSSAAPRVRTGPPHRRSVWAAPSPPLLPHAD